jgi:hypothetical protein
MAQISISGCKDRKFANSLKKLTVFVLNYFLSKRMVDVLEIDISISEYLEDSNNQATCIWEDEKYRPREFSIHLATKKRPDKITGEIKDCTEIEMFEMLAHELVHVKQWAKNEKYDYEKDNTVRFKGKIYDTDKLSYWEYPWELEAYSYELPIVQLWKEKEAKLLK